MPKHHAAFARSIAVLLLLLGLACAEDEIEAVGPPCRTTVLTGSIAVLSQSALDVLIVLDVAPSMLDEQSTLRRELPKLMRTLAEWRNEVATDIRIGLITADLGAGAAAALGCSNDGDGARLLGEAEGCLDQTSFLHFFQDGVVDHPLVSGPDRGQDLDALSDDVECLLERGVGTCGVRQPLEAMTRALASPTSFLRSDPALGYSQIFVLLITDGDDCSAADSDALGAHVSGADVSTTDARCAERPDLLRAVDDYVQALSTLRSGNEYLVKLSVIAGVPQDLVRSDEVGDLDLGSILDDPRMTLRRAATGDGLEPVCTTEHGTATPSRRVVEFAAKTRDAQLLSICEGDWSSALRPVTDELFRSFSAPCVRAHIANDGRADCTLTWTLPLPGAPFLQPPPTECDALPYLKPYAPRPRTADGRAVCEVHQLALIGTRGAPMLEAGGGFFFDALTMRAEHVCRCRQPGELPCGEIVFPIAVPNGVFVQLECVHTEVLDCPDGEVCDPSACSVP